MAGNGKQWHRGKGTDRGGTGQDRTGQSGLSQSVSVRWRVQGLLFFLMRDRHCSTRGRSLGS